MKMNHLPAARVAVFVRTRVTLRRALLLAPRPGRLNPNGILELSPGLRRRSYPGLIPTKFTLSTVCGGEGRVRGRLRFMESASQTPFISNPLISRFSQISFTTDRAQVPEKPESIERCSVNPQSAIPISFPPLINLYRAVSAQRDQNETSRNVPSCFTMFHHVFHLANSCPSMGSRLVPPCSAIFRYHFLYPTRQSTPPNPPLLSAPKTCASNPVHFTHTLQHTATR